jgi:ATP-binding cassette subfamily F protein 3
VLEASGLDLTAGDKELLRDAELVLERGEHVALVGPNGSGKTTLLETILGLRSPEAGSVKLGHGVIPAYFSQHDVELPKRGTVLDATVAATGLTRPQAQSLLGKFLFSGWEAHEKQVSVLSGGERRRLVLAHVVASGANLLVLDEPTNHLDMETREALTVALSAFEGALLLVSHDRHLLRATVDQLWLVHDGRLAAFDGDLDDYAALVLASRRERTESADDEQGPNRRELRKRQAQQRQRLAAARKPLQTKLSKLEGEIARLSDALRELDAKLADPDFYHAGHPDEVAATLKQRGELAQQLEALESHWLELTEQIESIA